MPTVSVVIPAYNCASCAPQAVRSALAQQGVDVEVIVVDDGSTDGTWEALEAFGEQITRVRQTNGGPAKARNTGARLASGSWLAFLDADDEWLPDKCVKQLRAGGERAALVYTDRLNVGHLLRVQPRQSDAVQLWEGDIFEALLLDNFITTSSVLIRKDRFEQLGGFDESRSLLGVEDWDLWLRHAADGEVGLCREALMRYRWHPGSLSSNFDHLSGARLGVLHRALALSRGQRVHAKVRRRAIARAWECSAWFAAPASRRKALGWYLRSAWFWPWNKAVYKGMVKCCLGMN